MIETFIREWPVLAGSMLAVLLMAAIAFALGFRRLASLDEVEIQRLAAAEGARLEHYVIAPDGRSAFALLEGGRLMAARVMGEDVSARILPIAAARFRFRNGKLRITFGDTGFAPLDLVLTETPPWLAQLVGGEAS